MKASIKPSKSRSAFWSRIYDQLETRKTNIQYERGKVRMKGVETNAVGLFNIGSEGICVMKDRLALEYQRIDRIQHHVGVHFCHWRDREHGMKVPFPCTCVIMHTPERGY